MKQILKQIVALAALSAVKETRAKSCLDLMYNMGCAWEGEAIISQFPNETIQMSMIYDRSGYAVNVTDSKDKGILEVPIEITCVSPVSFFWHDTLPAKSLGHMQMSGIITSGTNQTEMRIVGNKTMGGQHFDLSGNFSASSCGLGG